jgi:lysophospholipase L1-like esterase
VRAINLKKHCIKKSLIPLFTGAIILLSACTGGNAVTDTDSTTALTVSETALTSVLVPAAPENDTAVDPNVPVNLEEGVTDKMYSRSVLNEGDLSRLAAVMEKGKAGEPITVGVIGGSITQGSSASKYEDSYAFNFQKWWAAKFPESAINFVNAGIGGTNSYLGVSRVDEQFLSENPDVVVVEFSVNDDDKLYNKFSYDSLVRKILNHESNPAVILLFMTQEDGTSLQETHKEIGAAYNLPMLSYREAILPEVQAGTLKWADISPDNIHPNSVGHGFVAQILSRFLNHVYDTYETNTDINTANLSFNIAALTSDYYKNGHMLNGADITADTMTGFEVGQNPLYKQFPDNWITKGAADASLTFTLECQTLGIFYYCTTDGKSGTYEVYVDGERKGTLKADFTGGWGNYGATKSIFIDNETVSHKIEIKPAPGSEDRGIIILGLMVS